MHIACQCKKPCQNSAGGPKRETLDAHSLALDGNLRSAAARLGPRFRTELTYGS